MQSKKIFQTIQEWARFSQGHRRKKKTPCNIDLEISMKSCSTTHLPFLSPNPKILKAFQKVFPPKWSLLNAQQKRKKLVKKSSNWVSHKSVDCFCEFASSGLTSSPSGHESEKRLQIRDFNSTTWGWAEHRRAANRPQPVAPGREKPLERGPQHQAY